MCWAILTMFYSTLSVRRVGLVEHAVITFLTPLHKSEINVTTDNWFTRTKLGNDLFGKQITLLETLQKSKPD